MHRIIISNAIKTLLQDTEVRSELTPSQLTAVDHICTHEDVSDNDFRYLLRRVGQAYCEQD